MDTVFTELTNARPLDVHIWSKYPEVNVFVNKIYSDLITIKGHEKTNKKLLKVLLLDLYVAWATDRSLKIMFSRDNNAYKAKSRYNELHIGKKIIGIVDHLVSEGFIHEKRGFNDRFSGSAFLSRLWPTVKLEGLFSHARFNQFCIESHEDRETIILRDENKKNIDDYTDNLLTTTTRDLLKDYNLLLANTHIDIEILAEGILTIGEGRAKMRLPINQTDKFVRRIFNENRWDKGGRFYGGWWQRCPKEYRIRITMDDIPTAELDYSGLHIVILYALEGINYWSELNDDPYDIESHCICDEAIDLRAAVKLLMLTALNATSEKKAFKAFRSQCTTGSPEKKLKDDQLKSILDALRRKHPLIEHKFASGAGIDLMFIDSQITEILIERFTRHYECPILTVHDSYIVPFGYDHILQREMEAAFEKVTGIKGPVIKHTTDYFEALEGEYKDDEYPKNSWLSSIPTERHKKEWELFKEFKGKPDREDWVPSWTLLY